MTATAFFATFIMTTKTIHNTAESLAQCLIDNMPLIASLPEKHIIASFLKDGLRHQFGANVTELVAVEPAPAATIGALSEQVGGTHYKDMPIQHAEFCQRNQLPWCESAAIKYLCRHRKKHGVEDLKKAVHYVRLCAVLDYGKEL